MYTCGGESQLLSITGFAGNNGKGGNGLLTVSGGTGWHPWMNLKELDAKAMLAYPSKSSHWESPGNHDRIARSIVIVSRSIYRVYRGSTACIVEVPCVPRVFHERPNVRAFTRFLVKIFDSSRKQGDNARRKYTNELCSTEGYRNTFVIKCVSINGLDDTGSSTKVQVR